MHLHPGLQRFVVVLAVALVSGALTTRSSAARVLRVVPAGFLDRDSGVCSVPSSQRVECGFRGVQRSECLRANCCWRDLVPNRDTANTSLVGQQTQCYHRVAVATLEDRTRITQQVATSEAHVWRVYNPKGLSPARFVVEFPVRSDIDMLVKCCDSSGGASPTCPDFDNHDFWSRDLPRRSPFRFDVYDSAAASCGEWGIMVYGLGLGNQSYTIYSEVDRDLSVVDMAHQVVYSGSMIRDDWRFYRFHVRRAYNVHIPLHVDRFSDRVRLSEEGKELTGSKTLRWNASIPIDARSARGFSFASVQYAAKMCTSRVDYATGVLSIGGERAARASHYEMGGCRTVRSSSDISGLLGRLVNSGDLASRVLEFEVVSTLPTRGTYTHSASWRISYAYNAEVALYARWDHLPNWLQGTHDTEVTAFERPDQLCLRLEFDVPRTGILYVGFNITSASADYRIQALQSNRGDCVIWE